MPVNNEDNLHRYLTNAGVAGHDDLSNVPLFLFYQVKYTPGCNINQVGLSFHPWSTEHVAEGLSVQRERESPPAVKNRKGNTFIDIDDMEVFISVFVATFPYLKSQVNSMSFLSGYVTV